MQGCMEDLDPMDSEVALNFAVDRKSSTILEAELAVQQCGSGLYSGKGGMMDDEMHDKI